MFQRPGIINEFCEDKQFPQFMKYYLGEWGGAISSIRNATYVKIVSNKIKLHVIISIKYQIDCFTTEKLNKMKKKNLGKSSPKSYRMCVYAISEQKHKVQSKSGGKCEKYTKKII